MTVVIPVGHVGKEMMNINLFNKRHFINIMIAALQYIETSPARRRANREGTMSCDIRVCKCKLTALEYHPG
jgi:hypothetical protein